MRRKKRSIKLLILAKLGLIGFLYMLFFTKPTQEFAVGPFSLQSLPLFLFFLFVFLSAFTVYLTYDIRKGVLIGIGFTGYLTLRFLHLAQPFFLLVFLALLASLAFVLSSKRN